MNKIKTYVGFAIKSNKVLIGQSTIKSNKNKQIYCILVCSSASENLVDLAKRVAEKNNCQAIVVENLEMLTHKEGLKIIAITDENLGNAIINNKENVSFG